jgi:pSer/pThr/pTyr-binding forkhead associated (FHA) protein
LVILRVVAVARREMKLAASATSSVTRGKNVVGHLVVIDNGSTALRPGARLDVEPITIIGRSPTCTIVLDSTFVSTEHTRILFKDRSLWVEDLNSRNSTLVNQTPVKDPVAVTPGTILQVGDVRFKFAV